jgi:uncharacterized protein with FMN-binding domain
VKRFLILAVLMIIPACSGSTGQSTQAQQAAPADSVTADSTGTAAGKSIDLMKYSTIDTCDGEFEGYYDEKVADFNLTVSATVRVKVEHCKVTDITIIDSSNVHPSAAKLIPRRIIEAQSLPVEAVAGASVASWTLMTATAVALGIDLTELEDSSHSAK